MKKVFVLFTVGFSALVLSAERLDTFDYSINSYPKNLETCEAVGTVVSAEFQLHTGLLVDSTDTHENDAKSSCEIMILYKAPRRVRLYTTAGARPSIMNASSQGLYSTRRECETDGPEQITIFEKATGLHYAIAYCFADETLPLSLSGETVYALRIDGFGKAKLFPHLGDALLKHDLSKAATEKIKAEVQRYLESKGAVVAKIAVLPNGKTLSVLPPELVVLYYSEKPISLTPY